MREHRASPGHRVGFPAGAGQRIPPTRTAPTKDPAVEAYPV